MSVENVKAFFEKVEEDKELQGKLKALAEKRKAQDEAEVAQVVKIASEAGYTFTGADLDEARKGASAELPEDELRQIAGGGGGSCPFCAHQMTRYVRD